MELLIVISILAVLAAMLFPVSRRGPVRMRSAEIEMAQISNAIHQYESAYGKLPVPKSVIEAAAKQKEDFTYGTYGLSALTAPGRRNISIISPGATMVPAEYQTNNAELMAVLLDLETYGNGVPTINKGHAENPQHVTFLNAKIVSDTKQPGLGPDGVYRDPWKNPYIMSIDLNGDGKCRDSFYRRSVVSRSNNQAAGKGLVNLTNASNAQDNFECNDTVMIWSAGPDGMIELGPANAGANKDNVLSWR